MSRIRVALEGRFLGLRRIFYYDRYDCTENKSYLSETFMNRKVTFKDITFLSSYIDVDRADFFK